MPDNICISKVEQTCLLKVSQVAGALSGTPSLRIWCLVREPTYVVGLISSWGYYGRQLIDVSLPHRCFSLSKQYTHPWVRIEGKKVQQKCFFSLSKNMMQTCTYLLWVIKLKNEFILLESTGQYFDIVYLQHIILWFDTRLETHLLKLVYQAVSLHVLNSEVHVYKVRKCTEYSQSNTEQK